jgi:hypothetical protein
MSMGAGATTPETLAPDVRRWLHDKYERLAAEESQLAASRTSYYAAIGTVLITALIVVTDDFLSQPHVLLLAATFLAGLGIMISLVWAVLLHRTNDAQNMWRQAARDLEEMAPPIPQTILGPITLRTGDNLQLDLARPYEAHARRFSSDRGVSWMDRVNPERLTEALPLTFLTIWVAVLLIVWVYFGL